MLLSFCLHLKVASKSKSLSDALLHLIESIQPSVTNYHSPGGLQTAEIDFSELQGLRSPNDTG